jgi:hypothetical protein
VTKEQFDIFWTSRYPNTIPISYRFRDNYPDRWFRIHSLPQSQRYAETDSEWITLLTRQNQIITELLGEDSNIIIVTGEFNWGERVPFITNEEEVFKSYSFTRLDNIDLYKLIPDDYDKGEIYRPAFAETIWKQNKHDKLLREIAVDSVRVFFASIDNNIIIAPYDGGIDIVLKDTMTRDNYKLKYKDWLSEREDGC